MKKILFILILLPSFAFGQISIVTSNLPLASIIKMVGGEKIDITIISKGSHGCAHHHKVKPSQITAITKADLIVAIDPKFDGFMFNSCEKSKIHFLSHSSNLKLLKNNSWHIWLSIKNTIKMLESIERIISNHDSNNAYYYGARLKLYNAKLSELKASFELKPQNNLLIIDNNLQYLASNFNNFIDIFLPVNSSINSLSLLQSNLNNGKRRLLISEEYDLRPLETIKDINIITIKAENWQDDKDLEDLYIKQLKAIISRIL